MNNEKRHVGFEIEYIGLPLDQTADVIKSFFGGEIHKYNVAQYIVKETDFGDFTLEVDASLIQEIAKKSQNNVNKDGFDQKIQRQLGKAIQDIGTEFVPNEIICPPVEISDIPKLQKLCDAIKEKGAKGTKDSISYAFGLHINPEVISFDVDYILKHIQSFLLLSSWLKKIHNVDLSRQITSFIDPFPANYYKLILNKNYKPDLEKLIRDYHEYNPTRNRALDMLPLFSHLDKDLVARLYGIDEKISARPTFHYRLPNCEIGNVNWGLDTEWRRWLLVEKVAQDDDLLDELMVMWHTHQDKIISTQSGWVKLIDKRMAGYHD